MPYSPRTLLILRLAGILLTGVTIDPAYSAIAEPLMSFNLQGLEPNGVMGYAGAIVYSIEESVSWWIIGEWFAIEAPSLAGFLCGLYLVSGGTAWIAAFVEGIGR